jgi:hypothetical protein
VCTVNMIAAVHSFDEFKILLRLVVRSGRIYLSLKSFQFGQAKRIYHTVIASVSQRHRGLETVGIILS